MLAGTHLVATVANNPATTAIAAEICSTGPARVEKYVGRCYFGTAVLVRTGSYCHDTSSTAAIIAAAAADNTSATAAVRSGRSIVLGGNGRRWYFGHPFGGKRGVRGGAGDRRVLRVGGNRVPVCSTTESDDVIV